MNIDQLAFRSPGKRWLYVFLVDVAADLIAVWYGCTTMRYVTKPLLMILLLIWFSGYHLPRNAGRNLVQWALIFSCGGDTLLLFVPQHELFFVGGLLSFLIAHIFYILFFIKVKKQNRPGSPWNPVVVFLVMVYTGFLYYLLRPGTGDLALPVLVYASVIAAMLLMTIHAFYFPRQLAGAFCVTGAFLFVVSDSMLALDKFYQPFGEAPILVMTTYCLAQLLLVTGCRKYLQSRNNP